ncbi:MAG: hypothetical protein J2P22_03625 [Nocardioides sp.]|nr:hypothetical protein [Nocardioides sp.]
MHQQAGRCLLAAVALGTLASVGVPTPSLAWTTRFGHVAAPDQVLRPDCHRYRYHYVVKPRSGDWTLETWLYDPRGRPRGSGDFAAGADPRRGPATFGVCRSTVVRGRFTIRARLRWYTPGPLPISPTVRHTRWLRPAHFRLTRP